MNRNEFLKFLNMPRSQKALRSRNPGSSYNDGNDKDRWMFTDQIFFGDGGMRSERQCYKLHRLLEECFVSMSGEQQNGGQGTEYNHESAYEDAIIIAAAMQDIARGLTGFEVIFVDPLTKEKR